MSSPSFVLELEIRTNTHEKKQIKKRMNIAISIYNSCLGYALKRLKAVRADKEYRALVKDKKAKGRISRLKEIERSYGYSEFQVHSFVKEPRSHYLHIGSNEAQKLATRAFKAVEKYHYHQAKRVNFKRYGESISIENKSNRQGLRHKDGKIVWGELILDYIIKCNDWYAEQALSESRIKYIRIIKRVIRSHERFFVQFVLEGFPPIKPNRKICLDDTKSVGLDVGTATIAIASEDCVQIRELAPACVPDYNKLRKIERAMDRSKRANNPNKFYVNGVAKKGNMKWRQSKRYLKLKEKRKEIHRKVADKRKQAHESLANDIMELGCDIRVENLRIQGLQKRSKAITHNKKNGKINRKKRYGKVIAHRAPAMLITIINRKLGYQERTIKKIDTKKVKASQFNHVTCEYHKKDLVERWNENILGNKVQRDLYSAFLIMCTNSSLDSVDISECERHWDNFIALHHQEIVRIKSLNNKTLRWYVA